jgi:transcriptional regulator with XRE-family HTH domain
MERLQIGEVIYKLRKEKGITQEQLANFIGVSTAAVSKWEGGASYPDITLLPDLATFFGITIDKLLNYNIELSKSEVMEIYSECEKSFSSRSLDDAIQLSKSYLSKHPGSYLLKFRIGYLFFIYAWKAVQEQEIKDMMAYSIKLFDDVANNCKDDELVEASLFQLGALYSNFEEYDIAIEVLNKIKKCKCDPEDILSSIYIKQGKAREARTLLQGKLYRNFHEISLTCIGLANSYEKEHDYERNERYHELAIDIKEVLSPQGDKVMALGNEYYHLGEACLRHGKIEKALDSFKTMLDHVKHNDINILGDFAEVWCFNELKRGEQKLSMNLYENLYKLFEQPVYESIRDNEEFKRIMAELRGIEKRYLTN